MARPRSKPADGDTVIVKKYANRRLYDTNRSAYITLEDLAGMVRAGDDFRVVDAKTDEDITHSVLTQIIMEEETRGKTLLPVKFLRQIIGMYGDAAQQFVPGYLEQTMSAFKQNAAKFQSGMASNPFAEMARRNLEMFQAAASAFVPQSGKDAEIAALKEEIAALRAELDSKQR